MPGFVNLDMQDLPGVDIVHDLDSPDPIPGGPYTEIIGVDLIEHVRDPLHVMAKLWAVAEDEATCVFHLPYGSTDDAWEDPTHRRPYFLNSWSYFSQPFYYRADYGYRADWQPVEIVLDLWDCPDDPAEAFQQVNLLRNQVARQAVALRAIKPARPCDRALIVKPQVSFRQLEA